MHFAAINLFVFLPCRYCQFYGQDEFCRYNMFNHHFFDDEEAVMFFQGFLHEEGGAKVVMVTDPPFGGLVKPLANTAMPMIWISPYFFESRILEYFPSFSMLDYQVDYDNHPLYKHGKTGRKQLPVRLFTSLSPQRYHSTRGRMMHLYVSAANKHCPNSLTDISLFISQDGQTGCFNCGSQKHKHRACPKKYKKRALQERWFCSC
uniref:Zinc finger, CCHC domain containing 4 n=1 Tax=Sinocyclocheilus grahami TaxID=75366 RepID=A0A672LQH3_SINGR